MTTEKKIQLLEKLLEKTSEITTENKHDADFIMWRKLVERKLADIFNNNSREVRDFTGLNFCSPTLHLRKEDDKHLEFFNRDLELFKKTINLYIEELRDKQNENMEALNQNPSTMNKIFISHSSKDKDFVEVLIDLIENIGLDSKKIFCTSFEGYGIELGEDFLARIKAELNENILVLFVLSDNFYESPVSLCEMGATWVKTSKHIPILIPPFDFKDIKGVIPQSQGLKINDKSKLNSLKTNIEKLFNLTPKDYSAWERQRDNAVLRINNLI